MLQKGQNSWHRYQGVHRDQDVRSGRHAAVYRWQQGHWRHTAYHLLFPAYPEYQCRQNLYSQNVGQLRLPARTLHLKMRHSCHAVSAPAFPTATADRYQTRLAQFLFHQYQTRNTLPLLVLMYCLYWPLRTRAGSILLARRAGYQLAKRLSNNAVTST